MLDDVSEHDPVEVGVRPRQRLDQPLDDLGRRELLERLAADLDGRLRVVDAGDVGTALGARAQDLAAATACVQHAHPRRGRQDLDLAGLEG